ncbi:hypothetical protein Pmar_PMAR024431, partial [Perkinsus marinus ATCC 50983]
VGGRVVSGQWTRSRAPAAREIAVTGKDPIIPETALEDQDLDGVDDALDILDIDVDVDEQNDPGSHDEPDTHDLEVQASELHLVESQAGFPTYHLQLSELEKIDGHIEQLECDIYRTEPEVQQDAPSESPNDTTNETKTVALKRPVIPEGFPESPATLAESHTRSVSSSAAIEDEILRDIAAGTYRDVGKKRRLTRASSCVPPDFNPVMEGHWRRILSDKSSAYSGTKLVAECLDAYQAYRVFELNKCEPYTPVPPLFNVSRGLADVWVRAQLKILEAPNIAGNGGAGADSGKPFFFGCIQMDGLGRRRNSAVGPEGALGRSSRSHCSRPHARANDQRGD